MQNITFYSTPTNKLFLFDYYPLNHPSPITTPAITIIFVLFIKTLINPFNWSWWWFHSWLNIVCCFHCFHVVRDARMDVGKQFPIHFYQKLHKLHKHYTNFILHSSLEFSIIWKLCKLLNTCLFISSSLLSSSSQHHWQCFFRFLPNYFPSALPLFSIVRIFIIHYYLLSHCRILNIFSIYLLLLLLLFSLLKPFIAL